VSPIARGLDGLGTLSGFVNKQNRDQSPVSAKKEEHVAEV